MRTQGTPRIDPLLVLAAAAMVLVFAIDLVTPLGVAVWLGYLVPVLLTGYTSGRRDGYLFAGAATLVIILGFFLSPPGVGVWLAAFNRFIACAILWVTAALLAERKRLLQEAHAQAESLAAANDLLQEQAQELELQTEELEVQSEELHAQNDELRIMTEQLETGVAQRTAELQRSNEMLQVISQRLVEVQENERRALSRELHDETAQSLTALKLGLGSMERQAELGAEAQKQIEQLKLTLDNVMTGVHDLAMNLRPAALDRAGLLPALEQYTDSLHKNYGLEVNMVTRGFTDGRLPPGIETTMYRVVQEALTNVARHASATEVVILLECEGGEVRAIVEDNGVGFEADAACNSNRLGLSGMRERLELQGGTFDIESQPGKGTSIYARVPLPAH